MLKPVLVEEEFVKSGIVDTGIPENKPLKSFKTTEHRFTGYGVDVIVKKDANGRFDSLRYADEVPPVESSEEPKKQSFQ